MLLQSSKNILIYSSVIAGLVILFLLVIPQTQINKISELRETALLVDSWKLEEAEKELEEITSGTNPSDKSLLLYLRTLLLRGKYLTAEALFNKHFVNRVNIPPEAILHFAAVNHFLGKINKSDSLCNAVLQDSLRSRLPKYVSNAYNILGLNKFFRAEYDSALLYQHKALKAAKSSGAQKEQADALRQLGVLAWYMGELDSALHNYYEPALNIYRNIKDKQGEATTLSDIGLLYFDWKNWSKEFFYQMKALAIRREIGDLMGIADSYNFLEHFPKLTKELEFFKYELIKKSYELSKKLGYKWGMEIASNSLQQFIRRNYELFGNFPFTLDSITYFSAEAKLFQLNNKISANNKSANQQQTISTYEDILTIADSIGYAVLQCNTLSTLSNFYVDENRLTEATEYLNRAIRISQSSAEPKFHFASLNILKAKLDFNKGNHQASVRKLKILAHYYDSLYIAESKRARNDLEWQSSLYSIYTHRNWTYSLLLDLLYETKNYDEFLNYTAKERRLLNWFSSTNRFTEDKNGFVNLFRKLTSLESGEKGDLVIHSLLSSFDNLIDSQNQRLKKSQKLTKSTIADESEISVFQKQMGANEIFIEFSLGEKYFYAAGITKEKISVRKITIPQVELNEIIFFFRKAIERGRWERNDVAWKTPAEYLYTLLLKPILHENGFEGKNKIIISPHNVLYHIPFASLIDKSGSDGNKEVLIDNFLISYSYSRKNYADYLENPINKFNSIMAFAPDNDKLKYSEKEISMLPASLFQEIKSFAGKEATIKNFLSNADSFDVLHIASHSEINNINPLQSKIKFSDGYLELFDFSGRRIRAGLVVLSSCESGKSAGTIENIPTSIDIVSFPEALLSSGTKSVLSTLWLVEDYSTAKIISLFYHNLSLQKRKNKIDITEALSAAMKDFISSQKENRHPFYWAPFIISN